MMFELRKKATLEEFEAFIAQPENLDKRFEYINGEIIEVPSNAYVSAIAAKIIILLGIFLKQSKLPGLLTSEGGGYIIDGQPFAPDVAYVHHVPSNKGFEKNPPLLAVEVISDPHSNGEQSDLRRKMQHYMNANVQVWVVDYVSRTVEVHIPGETMQVYHEESRVPGGDLLPGFELPVKDIFPETEEA